MDNALCGGFMWWFHVRIEEPHKRKLLTVKDLTLTSTFPKAQGTEAAEIQVAQLKTPSMIGIPYKGLASDREMKQRHHGESRKEDMLPLWTPWT